MVTNFPMESSDDFPDDVWSPSLRQELFSNDNIDPFWFNRYGELQSPVLPSYRATTQHRPTTPPQQRGINTSAPHPSRSGEQSSVAHVKRPSAFDPINTSVGIPAPSGQPTFPSHSSRDQQTPSATPDPYERIIPPSITSTISTDWSDSESATASSDEEGTPWPDDTQDFPNGFVDLTGSPPPMSPARNSNTHRREIPGTSRNQRSHATRPSFSSYSSEAPSNPAKRRKIGNDSSQSSKRAQTIEGIDLTGVDDDDGLSKVLEQQRLATIKAQQEQASKPVKLSSLQCIICMENMKDLTATSCGMLLQVT